MNIPGCYSSISESERTILSRNLFKGAVCDFLTPSAACEGNKKQRQPAASTTLTDRTSSAETKTSRGRLPSELPSMEGEAEPGSLAGGGAYVCVAWNK